MEKWKVLLNFKSPSRKLNSKPLAKARITISLSSSHFSHCNAPSPTLSNLANSFLPPTRKGMWPTPHPAPIQATYASNQSASISKDPILPQPTSKCIRRPHSSPTNLQGNKCMARPLLALLCLWAITTDTTMRQSQLFLIIRKLAHCVKCLLPQ